MSVCVCVGWCAPQIELHFKFEKKVCMSVSVSVSVSMSVSVCVHECVWV